MNDNETIRTDDGEERDRNLESLRSLSDREIEPSLVRQQETSRMSEHAWQQHHGGMRGMYSGDTKSFYNRPINDLLVDKAPKFDSIEFPIIRRIKASTLEGHPRTNPEPTGFKILIEIYQPEFDLVTVQPLSAPSRILHYMDFQYSGTA